MSAAWPDIDAEQPANGASNPPAGTLAVKVTVEPDSVPDTVPAPFTPTVPSTIVNAPEKAPLLSLSVHAIRPGPELSTALPDQVPVNPVLLVVPPLDGGVGAGWGAGVDEDDVLSDGVVGD